MFLIKVPKYNYTRIFANKSLDEFPSNFHFKLGLVIKEDLEPSDVEYYEIGGLDRQEFLSKRFKRRDNDRLDFSESGKLKIVRWFRPIAEPGDLMPVLKYESQLKKFESRFKTSKEVDKVDKKPTKKPKKVKGKHKYFPTETDVDCYEIPEGHTFTKRHETVEHEFNLKRVR